jgi:nucleoside-diphosphate-sugar epimerase
VYTHSLADGNIAYCSLDFPDIGHVIHLAAKTFVPDSWQKPHTFYEVNVLGVVNVLEFCRRSGASLTFLSSYVYGAPLRLPVPEDHPLRPFNPYCHSKILAEDVIQYYSSQFGVRATIIRPFNIYGPGQNRQFLIPTIIAQALDPSCDRIVVADLTPRRDYLHVHDLVDLIIATIGAPGGIYNAGSGESISVAQLVSEVLRAAGIDKPAGSRNERRPGEVDDVVADISRAKADLGWSPRIRLLDGLRGIIGPMRAVS